VQEIACRRVMIPSYAKQLVSAMAPKLATATKEAHLPTVLPTARRKNPRNRNSIFEEQ
jgi:hypothetical protein